MNLLNLSLGEFMAIAGVISAGVVALYLLDRSKRRHVVSTLRFWIASNVPSEWKRSRRIQQPWSLLLQLVSIFLLLLAIAGPRLARDVNAIRDHVLLLDTSAWMGARARQGVLLDQAKQLAIAYINAVPAGDRVMVVRADALATPVTPFETNREPLLKAIRQSQPSASALNLEQAIEFAQRAQRLQGHSGEIVFSGAARISRAEADSLNPPANLRILQVPSAGENVGIRKLGLRRSPVKSDTWEAFVGLKNDGVRPREIELDLHFGGATVARQTIALDASAEPEMTFSFTNPRAPFLEAVIRSTSGRGDAFPQDDRAVIDVPEEKTLKVAVVSAQPTLLTALLGGNSQVETSYKNPQQYNPQEKFDIVVFDRFKPDALPVGTHVIWIEPPAGSPFSIRSNQTQAKLTRWNADSPLAAGLYTHDVELATAQVFNVAKGDEPVAEVAAGPVVVARPGPVKMAAFGFHPIRSAMRYELASPLLMANVLRWMAPETFRRMDVQAGTIGTVNISVDKGLDPASIKITGEDKRPLPFTVEGNSLRFFSGAPGNVHVSAGDRETIHSLTLPDVAETAWKPAANVRKGVPAGFSGRAGATEWWPWLALLGGLGLLTDWLLYGRSHILRVGVGPARRPTVGIPALLQKVSWRRAS